MESLTFKNKQLVISRFIPKSANLNGGRGTKGSYDQSGSGGSSGSSKNGSCYKENMGYNENKTKMKQMPGNGYTNYEYLWTMNQQQMQQQNKNRGNNKPKMPMQMPFFNQQAQQMNDYNNYLAYEQQQALLAQNQYQKAQIEYLLNQQNMFINQGFNNHILQQQNPNYYNQEDYYYNNQGYYNSYTPAQHYPDHTPSINIPNKFKQETHQDQFMGAPMGSGKGFFDPISNFIEEDDDFEDDREFEKNTYEDYDKEDCEKPEEDYGAFRFHYDIPKVFYSD